MSNYRYEIEDDDHYTEREFGRADRSDSVHYDESLSGFPVSYRDHDRDDDDGYHDDYYDDDDYAHYDEHYEGGSRLDSSFENEQNHLDREYSHAEFELDRDDDRDVDHSSYVEAEYSHQASRHMHYESDYRDYDILRVDNRFVLQSSKSPEIVDEIPEGVDRVHFADFAVALDLDGVAGEAYRLYKAAFDRAPDHSGLGYWIEQIENGVAIDGVATAFVESDEFQNTYGADVSDADFIHLVYQNVLDRQADSDGYIYWSEQLEAGMGRSDLLVCFSESAENKDSVAELIGSGIVYQEWNSVL